LATLASGVTIAWLGRKLDTVDLRLFTAVLCAALATAAFGMALIPGVWALIPVFFLLRLTGQGLLSHTALTSMARYFDETRGKAMSVAGLGYPLGEAILPLLAVSLMGVFGWRGVWFGIGLLLLVVATPLTLVLLRGHGERHREHLERLDRDFAKTGSSDSPQAAQRQWTLREVTRDIRFLLMLPVVISPGFIVTGFFFHQNHLVDTKGWSIEWFATCFAIFAAGQVVTGIASGPLVDRFSGRRLLSVFALPMGAGLAALATGSQPAIAAVFMLGVGITSGLTPTVVGSMWAELYGVLHLGAIRAMASSIAVLGTAASPALMGWLIDRGLTMETMALAAVGYVIVASATVTGALRLNSSTQLA
jgi:MFS family permease